jgi:diaminopropionate ammonia-lyase
VGETMIEHNSFDWVYNADARKASSGKAKVDFLSYETASQVHNFHKGFPAYRFTPLQELGNLAKTLGVAGIWVKDESHRFGLNAFKALGGAFAIGKYLCEKLNMNIKDISFDKPGVDKVKEKLGDITFVTATDGNHGRGVAWAARKFGFKSVVYMPKGSAPQRLENIRSEGAEALITEFSYDEAVEFASENAKKYGWVLMQDTAFEGYEKIPTWIMQGYTTMVVEALDQLKRQGAEKPTHVLLQAGVGSFPAAVLGYLHAVYGQERPVTVIVEPKNVACILKSAKSGDGQPRQVTGDMDTIMAGLACGKPNPLAWSILRDYADAFVSCPDCVAARGMRILGNPLAGDPRVISGESGAVTTGLLSILLQRQEFKETLKTLNIDSNSKILVFSTEGDTDPEGYRRVIWDGACPSL